jgi:hypothetical protein
MGRRMWRSDAFRTANSQWNTGPSRSWVKTLRNLPAPPPHPAPKVGTVC